MAFGLWLMAYGLALKAAYPPIIMDGAVERLSLRLNYGKLRIETA
jgi:hypothetical protein